MARRLIEAGHQLVVFDQRKEAVDRLVALGARAASSPKEVADRAETVLASLPSLQASLEVATGANGVIEGKRVKRFVDLSTVGSHMAVRIHDLLAKPKTSCSSTAPSAAASAAPKRARSRSWCRVHRADFEAVKPALDVIGKVFFIGEKPGSAQTMKLANNLLSATAVVATSEAVVMGVKSGLDPSVMIDVINAGSGMNTASRDKFPRSILPRTFDFGFATGLDGEGRAALPRRGKGARDVDGGRRSGRASLGSGDPRNGRGIRLHLGDQADRKGGRRRGGRKGAHAADSSPSSPPSVNDCAHSHGAGLSIAIRASTSMRGRTTAYWSSLTSTSGTSARVL